MLLSEPVVVVFVSLTVGHLFTALTTTVATLSLVVDRLVVLTVVELVVQSRGYLVLTLKVVLLFVLLVALVGRSMEVCWVVRVGILSQLVRGLVVDVVVLDTVLRAVLQVVVQLVILVLDVVLQGGALMEAHVVTVVVTLVVAMGVEVVLEVLADMAVVVVVKLEVASVRVLWDVLVLIVADKVGLGVVLPVVWALLDAVHVVVLVNMLGVVFTVIDVGVVVAQVLVTLRLHVVVLTVLFSAEVTLVLEVRDVVLQVPVALLEVGIWVVFEPADKLSLVALLHGVAVLEGSLLTVDMHVHGKVGVALLMLTYVANHVALGVGVAF